MAGLSNERIRIRMGSLRSLKSWIVRHAEIVDTAKCARAPIVHSPIPTLPTRIERYTVLRTAHISTASRARNRLRSELISD